MNEPHHLSEIRSKIYRALREHYPAEFIKETDFLGRAEMIARRLNLAIERNVESFYKMPLAANARMPHEFFIHHRICRKEAVERELDRHLPFVLRRLVVESIGADMSFTRNRGVHALYDIETIGAEFTDSILYLTNCTYKDCVFDGTNILKLSSGRFENCFFTNCRFTNFFEHCRFRRCRFYSCQFPRNINFCDFAAADVRDCVFRHTDFQSCAISRSAFIRCNFLRTDFIHSDIAKCRFLRARFITTCFVHCGVTRTKFTNVLAACDCSITSTIFNSCAFQEAAATKLAVRKSKINRSSVRNINIVQLVLSDSTNDRLSFTGDTNILAIALR